MAYRSDVDALEARLRSLNHDIGERERERDEVARLLRDARNCDAALRWLEERPQRRSSRRFVVAAVVAGVLFWGGLGAYRVTHERQHPFEKSLQELAAYADEACACTDVPCAQRVGEALRAMSTEIMQRGAYIKPSEAQLERANKVATRLSSCVIKAMTRTRNDRINPDPQRR